MWEPVGPLAPSVYWRRRCVALGTLIVVLGGFVWAVVGLAGATGGDRDAAAIEARARAAAMAGTTAPEPGAGSQTAPGAVPGPAPSAGDQGPPGPIAAALPPVTPPGPGSAPADVPPPAAAPGDVPAPAPAAGEVPGSAPGGGPAPGGALLEPPGGAGFRDFLPPGVPRGSTGPLLGTTTTTPPSTPAPTPPPSTPPATSPSTPPTTTPSTPAASAPGPCADGDLAVTARTDATSYPAGRKPVLSLVVTNTGGAPCVRDLDAARQAVAVVHEPGDGLWASNDCSPGNTDDVRTLEPGEEAVFSVRWSGRTSLPGCTGERTTVPPGTYQLLARLDGIVSEPVSFTLEG